MDNLVLNIRREKTIPFNEWFEISLPTDRRSNSRSRIVDKERFRLMMPISLVLKQDQRK